MGILRNKVLGLIPRNNWDYGLRELVLATSTTLSGSQGQAVELSPALGPEPVATGSGRASLYAILRALDLPKAARVGVPLFCCSVVFDAIQRAGFEPEFIDIDLDDFNLSANGLARKRDRLAAVVVVHMFGNPADMDAIRKATAGLPIIEDCAQALFSSYKGRPVGLLSEASFFSFRTGKYVSAGEGSVILCRDAALRDRIKAVVNRFGWASKGAMFLQYLATYAKAILYRRPWYGLLGYPIGKALDRKLNLTAKDGFEARLLAPGHRRIIEERLKDFAKKVDLQRQNALYVQTRMSILGARLPTQKEGCVSNWFQFPLRFQTEAQRNAAADYLISRGIDCAKYLDGIANEARARYGYTGDCLNAELCSKTVLCVPIYYTLTRRDLDHIVSSLNALDGVFSSAPAA
jgi:dTDP-4-amino-4,6-dideoxygalactose transaminase